MKNYLIIGGSSGIGKQLTLDLSNNDHQVYSTFHNNMPEKESPNIHYHQLNVLDKDMNLDFLPKTLDGLAYCPGSINLKPFEKVTPSDLLEDYNLQIIGLSKVLQKTIHNLKHAPQSSVVLFSTVAVQKGFPFHCIVSSTKGAVEGFTKAMAAEYAPHVRFNCIAPSLTDTKLSARLLRTESQRNIQKEHHPLKRIGIPTDLSNMAQFLLSDKSSWITGQIMAVDGGKSSLNL